MGFVPPKMLQVDSMDDDLRNGLWNVCLLALPVQQDYNSQFYSVIFEEFLKRPADTLENFDYQNRNEIKKVLFLAPFHYMYDFIEYISIDGIHLIDEFNRVLKRERSGFRFIGGQLSRITDELEAATVASGMQISDQFSGARAHIRAAVTLFGHRGSPDYRNVIREAISAVESAAKVVSQNEKADLAAAIKSIEKAHGMHPAFKDAITKLYGWTSDENGIRHALLEASAAVDEADAHFMLVACAAFVNYLVSKYGSAASNNPQN
jgi:hypothetical protein